MLAKIAEVLANVSTAGVASSIPRVHLNFTFDPNDIGADSWTLHATLEGIEEIQEDGKVNAKVAREWDVTGKDPDTCAKLLMKRIAKTLESDLERRRMEESVLETALNYLTSDKDPEKDLPTLWPQSKEQAQALELMEQEGDGWARPIDPNEPQGLIPTGFTVVATQD